MRRRIVIAFVALHILLALGLGSAAWHQVDAAMRAQAEASARQVGSVLSQGGFTVNDATIARMRELTGYDFRLLTAPGPVREGTIQVVAGGRVVELAWRTPEHLAGVRAVLLGTVLLVIIGSALFAGVAVAVASRFARPLETLVGTARAIGSGDLAAAVPAATRAGRDEIAALARELETMRLRLIELDAAHRRDERLAALGTFTATIAHEVRNPLSAVRVGVQLLGQQGADLSAVTRIDEEIERLDLIVDELLAYSRGMSVVPVACRLAEVADDVVRLLRRQAEHAAVTLAVAGERSAVVRADAKRLRQLLINLVLNAIQAIQADPDADADAPREISGNVRIVLHADGVTVSDDGPGVASALVPRLFTAFSSSRSEGTGLGLHLAKAIADAHGASLRYAAVAPHGASFVLSGLPQAT